MSQSSSPSEALAHIAALDQDSFGGDDQARAKALQAARRLCQRLEKPWDSIARMFWAEPSTDIAIKVALDVGALRRLKDTAKPQSSLDLAEALDVDPTLVWRVLRQLASSGVVNAHGPDAFSLNNLSTELLTREASGSMSFLFEAFLPFFTNVPGALKQQAYRNPTTPEDCPWRLGMGTDLSFYEWLTSTPARTEEFGGLMRGFAQSRASWIDYYPSDQLFYNDDRATPILVDVGGGAGHDIEHFLSKHPAAKDRLILQDLSEVLKTAQTSAGVQKMEHDFFKPQPVHNARAYFMHSILHNWPNDKAKEILQNLIPAMRRGHSKILIQDSAVRSVNPTQLSTSLDIVMMSLLGGSERTEDVWERLLGDVGLSLTKIWTPPSGGQSLLEVDLR